MTRAMMRGARTGAVWGLVCALGAAASAQDATQPASQPSGPPASLAGFADDGKFQLYVNDDAVATIEFTWTKDGRFENTQVISTAGQTVTRRLNITPDDAGIWKRITLDTAKGPATLERAGDVARRTIGESVTNISLRAGAVLFENTAPALTSMAVRAYDRQKGGKQTLPVFFVPSAVADATLEALPAETRTIKGRPTHFARFTYGLPGVDAALWVDEDGRTCLVDIPAQHAAFVREGYDELRKSATAATQAAPEHEIKVDKDVRVPMRDGVHLATDIYRPDAEGRFPVILTRTPYKKDMAEVTARYYARRGYVFAAQDCRGRFGSEGTWEPFIHEADDGYDAIEWLAAQPWSSGKVGMVGASYGGWVQWWAASRKPPHLVTILPSVSPPDPFYNVPYEYGVFFLTGAVFWADVLESEATADISGAAMAKVRGKDYHKHLQALPVIELDKAVLGKENRYWRTWIAHPTNDAYWAPANFLDRLKDVRIPVFHQAGWYDGDGIGTKLNYLRMASHGAPHQKLVVGPWGHTQDAQRVTQGRDFGPEAVIDLQAERLRWLDHWLKGADNGVANEPLVSVFVMGANKWLRGNVYPLPLTRFEKWYLVSGGHANTSTGDGRLSNEPPTGATSDQYTYDPGDPTPDPNFFTGLDVSEGAERSVDDEKKAREVFHENTTRARKDILVYTTEPLTEALTIAGPVSAVLYAATTARDTDWFVRLMEVSEDGQIFPLVEGRLRARFRQSTMNPELLEPGRVYEYQLDLWQTGITIPSGRRLRVEVASASFPMFSRNLNTGGHNEMETDYVAAEQTIYHSAEYPSHVLLPVIPAVP